MWLHELLAAAKQHSAPLERGRLRNRQAINISPRWGEAAQNDGPAD
jgi:hypothetical protein